MSDELRAVHQRLDELEADVARVLHDGLERVRAAVTALANSKADVEDFNELSRRADILERKAG